MVWFLVFSTPYTPLHLTQMWRPLLALLVVAFARADDETGEYEIGEEVQALLSTNPTDYKPY
jgi:hypothetical protein